MMELLITFPQTFAEQVAKRSNIAKERTLIIYIFNGERQRNNKDKAENFKGRVFEKHLSFI